MPYISTTVDARTRNQLSVALALVTGLALRWWLVTSFAQVAGDSLNYGDLAKNLVLHHDGTRYELRLPLVGGFQVENALVAAGLAIATGSEPKKVFAALEKLGACAIHRKSFSPIKPKELQLL